MTNQRAPILVYHHVYPEDSPDFQEATFETGAGIIGETEFRRQLRYIVDNGWNFVSTTQVVDWLAGDAALPAKAVVLHFDNGWLDTFSVVLPILREFGATATCFPITDGVEAAAAARSVTVRTLTEGVVEKPFMNWDQTRALCDAGWEIGAHTATHCKIADQHQEQGDDGVLREAETANALFAKHLGAAPTHFAYPSGSRNARSDELLGRYYRSLRLWHFDWPIHWTFTQRSTSLLAVDCQNIDLRVPFADFQRLFDEAAQ